MAAKDVEVVSKSGVIGDGRVGDRMVVREGRVVGDDGVVRDI